MRQEVTEMKKVGMEMKRQICRHKKEDDNYYKLVI